MLDEAIRQDIVVVYLDAAAKAGFGTIECSQLRSRYQFLHHMLSSAEVAACLARLSEPDGFLNRSPDSNTFTLEGASSGLAERTATARTRIGAQLDRLLPYVIPRLPLEFLQKQDVDDPGWRMFRRRLRESVLRKHASALDELRERSDPDAARDYFRSEGRVFGWVVEDFVEVSGLSMPAAHCRLAVAGFSRPLNLTVYIIASEDELHSCQLDAATRGSRHISVLYLLNNPSPLEHFCVPGRTIIRLPAGLLLVIACASGNAIERKSRFAEEILKQADLTLLSPYKFHGAVSHQMFYGRAKELQLLVERVETSFAISGPRRIGKTSLAHELALRLAEDTERHEEPIYCDCSVADRVDDVYYLIARALKLRWRTGMSRTRFVQAVKEKAMKKVPEGRFVVILDEVDRLIILRHDEQEELFWTLRALVNDRAARVVLCGFRELRKVAHDLTHPAHNMCQPLFLGNLETDDAQHLIIRPMEALNVCFDPSGRLIAETILRETGTHPGTIQFFCHQLLEFLNERKGRTITARDVETVARSEAYFDFVLGGVKDLPQRHRLLIGSHKTATPCDFATIARNCRHVLEEGMVREVLDDLVDWLVIEELEGQPRTYRYSQLAIPRVVRTSRRVLSGAGWR